jgi:hypothetical protein
MLDEEEKVKSALAEPEEIRLSRSDQSVYLFYTPEYRGRWVCAVVKRENDTEGFLITAYPTDAVKEGVKLWPK